MVQFTQRDDGSAVWVNPDEVQSVVESDHGASRIVMKNGLDHVVLGSTTDVIKKLNGV